VTPFESLAQAITGARDFAVVHRRGLIATSVALLAGCAAAAFAIAPLAPDASALPQRVVVEATQPEAIAPQLEALAANEFDLNRSDATRPGDTAGSLLERLGVADASAVAFLRSDASARRLFEARGGRLVQVRAGEDGRLKSLVARSPAPRAEQVASHFTRLSVTRDTRGDWQAIEETLPLQSQARLASGTIRSTASCVAASTTGAATPSAWARAQLAAVTHHRSPGTRPGKRKAGTGVERSLPIARWCSRNSAVTTAQMVWLPRSSGPLLQHPSR